MKQFRWLLFASCLAIAGVGIVFGACSSEKKSVKPDETPTKAQAKSEMKEGAKQATEREAPTDAVNDEWRWKGDWKKYKNKEWIKRGQVLVDHVVLCSDCHTKRKKNFTFDRSRQLAGQEVFFDLAPKNDKVGHVPVANITPSKSGIRSWGPKKVKTAITKGYYKTDGGRYIMHPIMPYWLYNNLKDEHLNKILAYLRALKPVDVNIPDRQPQPKMWKAFENRTKPVDPLPLKKLPKTTLSKDDPKYETAKKGRYWAGVAGCAECHSPVYPPNPKKKPNQTYTPVKADQLFRGSRPLPSVLLGLPVPPFPKVIWSRNLTPHKNGLKDYGVEDIVKTMKTGMDVTGKPVCPPMPAGPGQALTKMPKKIKKQIATYIDTLPAKPPADHPMLEKMGKEVPPNCVPPSPEEIKKHMKKKGMKKGKEKGKEAVDEGKKDMKKKMP